jgi:hypothetical protein
MSPTHSTRRLNLIPDSRSSAVPAAAGSALAVLALATLVALTSVPALAAGEVALLKDLTAVITLLGLPCGEVVSTTTQSDSDHTATCKNGMRYRVFVNSEGRVVAQKQ